MLIFIVLTAIIILFTPFVFYSSNNTFQKSYRWIRTKTKSREETFRYVYQSILWIYFIIYFVLFTNSTGFAKLFFTLLFVGCVVFINTFPFNVFISFLFPFEALGKLISKVKKSKKKPAQKISINDRISKKISNITRLKLSTFIIYTTILLSFSFDILITRTDYWIIGIVLGLVVITYLALSLINIFQTQKDLIYLSDRLEESALLFDSIRSHKFFNLSKQMVKSFINAFSKASNKQSIFDKSIAWLESSFNKVQFISKMGVAVFRSLLTLKLIAIIFSTLLFYVIVIANYLISLNNLKIIAVDYTTYSKYLLTALYLFIGESISIFSLDTAYISAFILFLAISGWILSVTYIVLYFDIMNLSASDFNNAVNKSVTTLYKEIEELLNEMKNDKGDNVLDDIFEGLMKDKNILETNPDVADKLKNKIEELGNFTNDDNDQKDN
jgi:hypothetical protein